MRKHRRFLALFALALFLATVLVACDDDNAGSNGNMMGGDDAGTGMMDGDESGLGMMEGANEAPMNGGENGEPMDSGSGMMDGGTAWGDGAFASNGERIYFTGTSERSGDIDYSGGPDAGMMMMGGQLSCASCHGPSARGGRHQMHMETMDAPNIRWDALAAHEADEVDGHEEGAGDHTEAEGDYTLATFRLAVVEGKHPSGEPLSEDMPRWQMSDADLRDLAAYLQSLEGA